MKPSVNQNPRLQLAYDFVQYTGRHLFLTGKAGTGKTTFLKNLKALSPKRMIVVAPTGVAAINAGGVTIHSFFQLPFGPIVPGFSKGDNKSFFRFSKEKRNIIKSLDLLVIDEISMVRADLLDGIDEVLRRFRRNDLPFGGVQMLMIGDMQQLPPVVRDSDWDLLRNHYNTAYFYGSLALRKAEYVTITLEHVYRQQDQQFLDILNKIRDKQVDREVIETLKKRYKPNFEGEDDNYIILTTHNAKAKEINESRLKKLPGKQAGFSAEIQGAFPEYNYPTDPELELKPGAQVMFVKNDPDPEKRFYNGKIGTVIDILNEEVVVQCPEDDTRIYVKALEWQNIRYTIDESSKEIKENIEGVFRQIPLKLAWAITIHKSQGLTFDKVIIDSRQAFAHGQVYVALSRCRTLQGMVLSSPFSPYSLKQDRSIEAFNATVTKNQPDLKELARSKAGFQKNLLFDLFDFSSLKNELHWFLRKLNENRRTVTFSDISSFDQLSAEVKEKIIGVSEKFTAQMEDLIHHDSLPEENQQLQLRIRKAAPYFLDQIQQLLTGPLGNFTFETDNREIQKEIQKAEERLSSELRLKTASLDACREGFVLATFLEKRAKAAMDERAGATRKKPKKAEVSEDIYNPALYEQIKQWRNAKAQELGVSVFMVLPLRTIRALSNYVPSTMDDLKLIPGLGKKKLEQYGSELIDLLNTHRENHSVEVQPILKVRSPQKKPKRPTKEITKELWLKHRDIAKVAQERDLVNSTIEGHLAYYVGRGELPVEDFLAENKKERITRFMKNHPEMPLSEVKTALGDGFTYADLRFVKQHLAYLEGLQ